jgi:hypothetical protein
MSTKRILQLVVSVFLVVGTVGCDSGGANSDERSGSGEEVPRWTGKYNLSIAGGEEIQRDIDVWWDVTTERIREVRQGPTQSGCGVDTLRILSIEEGETDRGRDSVRTVTPEKDTLQFNLKATEEGNIDGRLAKTPGKWTNPPRYPEGEGGFFLGDSVDVDILQSLGCQ